MLSIQPWSKAGSNITGVLRPWTGIVLQKDGVRILVYCEATLRSEANDLLTSQARVFDGTLEVVMFGHHDVRVLVRAG